MREGSIRDVVDHEAMRHLALRCCGGDGGCSLKGVEEEGARGACGWVGWEQAAAARRWRRIAA